MKKNLLVIGASLLLAGCGITATPEEMAAFNQSMQNLGQSFNNNNRAMPTYQAPAIQPYSTGRTNTYC